MKRFRVLFVCVGNACRSQMAEGFAKQYGADVVEAVSAGLAQASFIPPQTRAVMAERGVDLETHFPKSVDEVQPLTFDWVVNLSGTPLTWVPEGRTLEWRVRDPVGCAERVHREVRDEIEVLVRSMVDELRYRAQGHPPKPLPGSGAAVLRAAAEPASRVKRWLDRILGH